MLVFLCQILLQDEHITESSREETYIWVSAVLFIPTCLNRSLKFPLWIPRYNLRLRSPVNLLWLSLKRNPLDRLNEIHKCIANFKKCQKKSQIYNIWLEFYYDDNWWQLMMWLNGRLIVLLETNWFKILIELNTFYGVEQSVMLTFFITLK